MMKFLCKLDSMTSRAADWLAPLVDLVIRFYIAKIFFYSALTKISNWDSTVSLFKYEYHVPLLSPEVAAYLGTAAELILPVLFLIGFGGRIVPTCLFIFNIMAVVSYRFLFTDQGAVGLEDHVVWGLLIAMVIVHGYGKWSLDYLLRKKLCHD